MEYSFFPEKRHQRRRRKKITSLTFFSPTVCIYNTKSIVIIINNNRILLCLVFFTLYIALGIWEWKRIKEHFKDKSSFAVFFSCLLKKKLPLVCMQNRTGKEHTIVFFFVLSSPLSNIIVCLTHLCLQSPLTFPYMSCIQTHYLVVFFYPMSWLCKSITFSHLLFFLSRKKKWNQGKMVIIHTQIKFYIYIFVKWVAKKKSFFEKIKGMWIKKAGRSPRWWIDEYLMKANRKKNTDFNHVFFTSALGTLSLHFLYSLPVSVQKKKKNHSQTRKKG